MIMGTAQKGPELIKAPSLEGLLRNIEIVGRFRFRKKF